MAGLRLGPPERAALVDGARTLGVDLDTAAVDRLAAYAALLDSWSARTSLISCRGAGELVERHLLDSLALARCLDPAARVADLGSGAGFPGVPLAIAGAAAEVLLVEARRRRANFLRTVKRELGLEGVAVLEQRGEVGPPASAAALTTVVCRAVWPDAEVFHVAARWLKAGGRLLWMRAATAPAESGEPDFRAVATETYLVGSGPVRAVHVFERR